MSSVRIFGAAKAKDTIKRVKRKEINPLFHTVFFAQNRVCLHILYKELIANGLYE